VLVKTDQTNSSHRCARYLLKDLLTTIICTDYKLISCSTFLDLTIVSRYNFTLWANNNRYVTAMSNAAILTERHNMHINSHTLIGISCFQR